MSARKSFSSGNGRNFASGSVTRIWARNFLTFTEFEMHPEPNLNLIIGPNGTGKSSLVNALVLGLAGKPSVLGRASNITDYIQYGKDKASLKIELFNEKGPNWEIHREIKRSGGSTWAINNKPATMRNVEELMSQLKIQVGNLCQFLPQDKVADFAKMNPVDLFQNTQKAAGSEKLFSQHQMLIEKRTLAQQLERDVNTGQANLDQELVHHNRIQEQLKHNEQRESHLAKVQLLKEKKTWLLYTNIRDVYVEKRKDLERMKAQLNVMQKKTLPQQKCLADAKLKMQTIQHKLGRMDQSGDASRKIQAVMRKIDDLKDKITDTKSEYQFLKEEENQRVKRIESLNLEIKLHEDERNSYVKDDSANQMELQAVDVKITAINQDLNSLHNVELELKVSHESNGHQMAAYQSELRRLTNIGRQREEKLRNDNPHAYQGLQWMRQHKNEFKKNVFEPIMLQINMLDPAYARYVENLIPMKDLVAFAFEDRDDREFFMREVRDKQNLRVNAVEVPKESLASFCPKVDIGTLKKYGFQCYLKDVFQAPEGIMAYLCKRYRVHNIPIGNDATDRIIADVVNETNLSSFFTSTSFVGVKVSKYSHKKFSWNSQVRVAKYLAVSAEHAKIQQLEQQIKQCQEIIEQINQQIADRKMDGLKKMKEREELLTKKKKLLEPVTYLKTLEVKIRKKIETRDYLTKKEVNLEEEARKCQLKIKNFVLFKARFLQENAETLKHLLTVSHKRVLTSAKLAVACKCVTAAEKKLKEDQESFVQYQQEVADFAKKISDLKQETRERYNNAKKASQLGPEGSLPEAKNQEFDKLPNTLDEVEDMMFAEQTRADLLCAVDPSVIEEFETRRKTISRLNGEIHEKGSRLEGLQSDIQALKSEWLPAVEELIDRINVNFSKFFGRLKCVGEIMIDKSNNEEDYHNWGVKIRVKFRDSEPLKELSSMNHSGGEQSVSTALYMLALQELTHVPFRCVDEINQGMDATNERKIFNFITETACQKNNAQYFLLTPKLLPNLEYSRNMKIFIIHNGQLFGCAENWNLRRFLQLAKEVSE